MRIDDGLGVVPLWYIVLGFDIRGGRCNRPVAI